MALNLRDFFSIIARRLRVEPRELERRARYLREYELLPYGKPGPGGGPPEATPASIALLLIGCLATDIQQDAGFETDHYRRLRARGPKPCALTGEPTFGRALEAIVGDPALAARVEKVSLARWPQSARIEYTKKDHGSAQQSFGPPLKGGTWLEAVLHGDVLRSVARRLAHEAA